MEPHIQFMSKARTRLVTDHPFFASVVLRRPLTWTEEIPTAGITPMGNLFINPVFFLTLSVDEAVFVLAHEAMHYLALHGVRMKGRDPAKWNWATDAVINETLVKAKVGVCPEKAVRLDKAETMNAEQVYEQAPPPQDGDSGGGDGTGPGQHTLSGDVMPGEGPQDAQPITSEQAEALESKVKLEAAQARRAAKMQGKMPAGLDRFVEDLITVVTPWHDILERHMASFRLDDYSWARPNRRYLAAGMYMPGKNYVPEMGEVVIAVDTSGSVGPEELAHFFGHMKRIAEDCRPTKVHVVYCDARVAGADEFENAEEIEMRPRGGGGTAFKPVFDWVEEEGIEPDVLVYLTDLCGPTDFQAPNYPTIWLTTHSEEAPFGTVVPYSIVED